MHFRIFQQDPLPPSTLNELPSREGLTRDRHHYVGSVTEFSTLVVSTNHPNYIATSRDTCSYEPLPVASQPVALAQQTTGIFPSKSY